MMQVLKMKGNKQKIDENYNTNINELNDFIIISEISFKI